MGFQVNDPEKTGKRMYKLIGYLAFLLPIILFLLQKIRGEAVQTSFSHNYYTNNREIFTGTLIGIGLFMLCYVVKRGIEARRETAEQIIAKICGVLCILVAFFPTSPFVQSENRAVLKEQGYIIDKNQELNNLKTDPNYFTVEKYHQDRNQYTFNKLNLDKCDDKLNVFPNQCQIRDYNKVKLNGMIHTVSAFSLFVLLGIMSICVFGVQSQHKLFKRLHVYFGIAIYVGILMCVSTKCEKVSDYFTYIGETLLIFAFGASWLLKGYEDKIFQKFLMK